jgi:23S rRNA-/tRNA-specific pseudouridylate synthase
MLTGGRVLVNGTPVYKAKELLVSGDEIQIINHADAVKKSPPPRPKRQFSKLKIMFEDDFILVVEKPAGLLSVATDKQFFGLVNGRSIDQYPTLCQHFPQFGFCRLRKHQCQCRE